MAQLCRKFIKSRLRRTIQHRISVVRPCILRFLQSLPACYGGHRYRMLPPPLPAPPSPLASPTSPQPRSPRGDGGELVGVSPRPRYRTNELELGLDSDVVALKISLLGDCQIGKTSFLVKYVGDENEEEWRQRGGLNKMDKTLDVRGARISYCMWEVSGNRISENQVPMACKDSVAILIMFDLTSRCTLNSVLGWYKEARKHNQSAIPVMVGTKFDDFIQLPLDLQWAISSQARAYARAINATLFFSSATYNINVNKIFKFITAKLFDLPWTVERNLRIGEPIIDF